MQWLGQPNREGVGDAGPQVTLGGAEAPEGGAHVAGQDEQVVRPAVGQDSLGELPDVLVRVQLGGVGRKVLDAEAPEAAAQSLDQGSAMDLDAIPEHDEGAAKVAEQLAHERADVGRLEVVARMAPEVESAVVAARAERDGREDRDPVVPLPVAQRGRVALRCPGAAHRRRQEEAALVEEDEVGAQPCGVFFTRGQSWAFHRAMASSSRSSALRSGFWELQPN